MKKNTLDSINKNSGFKTPKNYFSQLEEQIFNEVHLIDKTETSGFETPDGYFDTVEQNILANITKENDTKVISLMQWKKVMYVGAVAACLVLMFNIIFQGSEPLTFETIETAAIEDYLEDEDYSGDELASLLTEDELNKDNFIDNKLSEENIEDYLLDNVDIEDLTTEQIQ
ncbi:hypothetical protein [Psychroserpens sp. MEBiC05023]